MADTKTFDVPDSKQTLKKLPYEGAVHQHCGWPRVVEMPTHVMYVRECHCHQCNQKAGRRPLATLKTVLMTSLTILVILLIIHSANMSSCGESHVSKEVPVVEEEMMADVGGHRVERDLTPFGERPKSIPKRANKEHKHKHRKSKGKKRLPRSRRSHGGRRRQVQVLAQRVQENREQIAILNRSLILNNNLQGNQRVAVHLTYTYANEDSLVYGAGYFVWTLMPSSPGYDFFHYSRAPNQASGRDIYGVQVQFEGQYLVYSQVLINGRNAINYLNHFCAHETMVVRTSQVQELLLKSYITQDGLGLPLGSDDSGNDGDPALRPKDTTFQMGVFYLRQGDEVRIRIPDTCTNFHYSGDQHGSYFGLVRL